MKILENFEGFKKIYENNFNIGDKVKVADGSGTLSNKKAIVVSSSEATKNGATKYKNNWNIPVKFENGEYDFLTPDILYPASDKFTDHFSIVNYDEIDYSKPIGIEILEIGTKEDPTDRSHGKAAIETEYDEDCDECPTEYIMEWKNESGKSIKELELDDLTFYEPQPYVSHHNKFFKHMQQIIFNYVKTGKENV